MSVNLNRGGADGVSDAIRRTEVVGILPAGPQGGVDAPPRASVLSALAGPAWGRGLAGGAAATGLVVLVLAVKLLLVPLYTRLRRDRMLDNPVRARLYERVRADPGIHRAVLVDYAGIGEGATRHHLRQMTKHQLLVELDVDGFVRYYAAGEVPPHVARREALLRAETRRRVYDLYAAEPSLPLRAAATRLGMSAPSVFRARKQLETAGLLPAKDEAAAAVAAA